MARNTTAISVTDRASGPTTSRPARMIGRPCARATRPAVGLNPTSPQWEAGNGIDPPPSVPIATAPIPVATAAAAPALDDPVVSAGRQGLRVVPYFGVVTMPRPLENSE